MNNDELNKLSKDKQDKISKMEQSMFANYEIIDYKNNIDLSNLETQLVKFSSSLKFIGHYYEENSTPVFLFNSPNKDIHISKNISQQIKFVPYGWDFDEVGCFTLTIYLKLSSNNQVKTRVTVASNSPILTHLKNGRAICLFVYKNKIILSLRVNFNNDAHIHENLINQISVVTDKEYLLYDPIYCVWGSLHGSDESFIQSSSDRLSKVWAETYLSFSKKVFLYDDYYKKCKQYYIDNRTNFRNLGWLGSEISCILDSLSTPEHNLEDTYQNISDYYKDKKTLWPIFLDIGQWQRAEGANEMDLLPMELLKQFIYGAEISNKGNRLPSISSSTGKFEFIELERAKFNSDEEVAYYWIYFLLSKNFIDIKKFISKDDKPLTKEEVKQFDLIKSKHTNEEINEYANSLLEEASHYKQWSIPWGATVEINFGPICYIQLYEIFSDVYFVLRSSSWNFSMISCCPNDKSYSFGGMVFHSETEDEKSTFTTPLKLILASIVRDFYVVEERERVFSPFNKNIKVSAKKNKRNIETIIYLPKVIYIGNENIKKLDSELEPTRRRIHDVKAHLRKTEQASIKQLALAKKYGFKIPTGYTFVRPHERGQSDKEVIYKSKSATKCLYEEIDDVNQENIKPQWFKFEQDAAQFLTGHGFEVIHHARSRNGDEGIDLLAYKQDGGNISEWVIQCKCWKKGNNVGPDVIRELIGVMKIHKENPNGMVVTTSDFTRGAKGLADQNSIVIINGAQFIDSDFSFNS